MQWWDAIEMVTNVTSAALLVAEGAVDGKSLSCQLGNVDPMIKASTLVMRVASPFMVPTDHRRQSLAYLGMLVTNEGMWLKRPDRAANASRDLLGKRFLVRLTSPM